MREAYLYIVALALLCLYGHAVGSSAPDAMAELLHAVDKQFKVSATVHIDHILTGLLRGKRGLILCREVLKLYARGKVVHTKGGNSQWLGIILRGDGLALHAPVVPEGTLHALLAFEAALRSHQALHHPVVGQIATLSVKKFLLLRLDAVENGDGMVRRTVVVTPHHRLVVGIGTDNGNTFLILLEGKHIVLVLQQHDGLTRHVEGYLAVFLGIHCRIWNFRPLDKRGVVHLAQVEAALQQSDDVLVDLSLCDITATDSFGNASVGIAIAALHIGAGNGGLGRGMNG